MRRFLQYSIQSVCVCTVCIYINVYSILYKRRYLQNLDKLIACY